MNHSFFIQWHITNRCNLRCRHCYQKVFSKSEDLDWSGLKRVSENVLETLVGWNKSTCIHLTGGEPLLKPEFFLLLDDLGQNPIVEELGVITNGLLIDQQMAKRFSAFPKLKKVKISLDGADPETNDSIRQKGSFEKVIKNLSFIKNENRFEIILMFTVMKRNYRSLSSLIPFCNDLGVDGLILERFIPLGRGMEIRDEVLEKDQWREVVQTLCSTFSMSLAEDDIYPYQAFQVVFDEDETELLGAPCILGRDGFCIMPEGSVFPCRRFPIPIGNLLKDSLNEMWEKSILLDKLREKGNMKGRCGRCEREDCRGCRSLAFALTGDYLEEDPHCPLNPAFSSSFAIG